MSSLHGLSNEQKEQVRNAFTLISSNSGDGAINASDLTNIYKTLDLEIPSDAAIKDMLGGRESMSFAQFTSVLAGELAKLDDKMTISNALRVFATEENKQDLVIDLETFKDACCSVQLGDIGSGDHRLSRSSFDSLVKGFVREEMDGKKKFNGSLWLDAYI